eukprot:9390101-Ditylum_brightwellii.AAC.1
MQQKLLQQVLEKTPTFFDRKFGLYPHRKIHLEVQEDAKPYHAKAYLVPHGHLEVFKQELLHLVAIGVLQPCGPTGWTVSTFIIPNKDGHVHWISDFCELNWVFKQKIYQLPIIQDVMQKWSSYTYFTKIDLSMFFYTLELDEESKELCTIVTPFSKFQYCHLAMGLKVSPDIAKAIIEEMLHGAKCDTFSDTYMDDAGIFSNGNFEEHMELVARILEQLEKNGMQVNPLKCKWAVKETDFLGHWLTPEGIKPWKKKVEAVLKMVPPQDMTKLRAFIRAVTYYKNIWP